MQVPDGPPVPDVEAVLWRMSRPEATPVEKQAAAALRQLGHLQAMRPLPRSLLQLLPGGLWDASPGVLEQLLQRGLLLRRQHSSQCSAQSVSTDHCQALHVE